MADKELEFARRKKKADRQRQWAEQNRETNRQRIKRSYFKRLRSDKEFADKERRRLVFANEMRNVGFEQQPRRRQRWLDVEIQDIYRSDMTLSQIAEKLGRSYRAVEKARVRYIDRAPVGFVLCRPGTKQ